MALDGTPFDRDARRRNPRILVVTPEITYLPGGMGNMANRMSAKAGGLADVSASLVAALFDSGADVHVALPHYRRMFHVDVGRLISDELRKYKSKLPDARIHLAEDRCFYYRDSVYSNYAGDNPRISTAFQREVINNILPRVNPDLVHCNDWMTGLIPAAARRQNIPCLFTLHNIHTHDITLERIEDAGIDAAEFWLHLYYKTPPSSYEATRANVPVDLLASGIFAAHFINTVSPTFLNEITAGYHDFIPPHIRQEIVNKQKAGCAAGILNAPDDGDNPRVDSHLPLRYDEHTYRAGKQAAKREVQERTGLRIDPYAPLFFWPSRLDPIQKGCQLLAHILYETVVRYHEEGLQILFVANGAYQEVFHNIVHFHNLHDQVSVCDFSEDLSRLAYAAADFMLMPSRFEPCGLPQMISMIYGSLPLVHDTGGLHDTVSHLSPENDTGNGFVFETYDCGGLAWAIDQAMCFFRAPADLRDRQIARIMRESAARFTHAETAKRYVEIYEAMLHRPLVNPFNDKGGLL